MRKNFLLFIILLLTLNLSAQKTYIWCGTLIDGISDEPKKNMTIVIEKNKIVAVENGFSNAGSNASRSLISKQKQLLPAGSIVMFI